jgi:hypothetical protein
MEHCLDLYLSELYSYMFKIDHQGEAFLGQATLDPPTSNRVLDDMSAKSAHGYGLNSRPRMSLL